MIGCNLRCALPHPVQFTQSDVKLLRALLVMAKRRALG